MVDIFDTRPIGQAIRKYLETHPEDKDVAERIFTFIVLFELEARIERIEETGGKVKLNISIDE
jgi:hypothetical protein